MSSKVRADGSTGFSEANFCGTRSIIDGVLFEIRLICSRFALLILLRGSSLLGSSLSLLKLRSMPDLLELIGDVVLDSNSIIFFACSTFKILPVFCLSILMRLWMFAKFCLSFWSRTSSFRLVFLVSSVVSVSFRGYYFFDTKGCLSVSFLVNAPGFSPTLALGDLTESIVIFVSRFFILLFSLGERRETGRATFLPLEFSVGERREGGRATVFPLGGGSSLTSFSIDLTILALFRTYGGFDASLATTFELLILLLIPSKFVDFSPPPMSRFV